MSQEELLKLAKKVKIGDASMEDRKILLKELNTVVARIESIIKSQTKNGDS